MPETDQRKVSERLAVGEVEVLRLVAAAEPLPKVLDALVWLIETSSEGTIGSVLLVDSHGRIRHGSAPGLPPEYMRAIDGQPIGPVAGSCGTAAYRREMVVVEDIATDPLWGPYRDLALGFGLRSCWSVPIFGEREAVIGTFALYDKTPRKPTPALLALAHHASVIASLAIQRHLKDLALAQSEARSRMIIENALDAHVMIDTQGVVRQWCPRAQAMFGFDAEHALGRRLTDLIVPPAQRAAHAAGLARFLRTGETRLVGRRVEVEAMHQRGHVLPVELAVTKIVDGDETFFSAFVSDLSARRAAESALRENDLLLNAVYDNVGDVLFHLVVEDCAPDDARARRFRFTAANPAFYKATGLTADHVIGKTVDEVIPEPSRSAVLAEYEQAIITAQPRRWMETTPFPTGERTGEVTVTPVLDAKGKAIALVGSVHDMTEHLKLERELRNMQRAEIIGRLSAGVAHDFNNILSVVLLGAEMLDARAHGGGVEGGDPLREIMDAGRAGTRLTRQFLALSRKQRIEPSLVDVGQIVKDLEPMSRRLLREDVTLTLELSDDLTLVMVDPVQLEQAIINLVVNARDAIPGAGRIVIRTTRVELDEAAAATITGLEAGPHVVVSVSDTGIGMSEAVMKRVLEPFFTTKAQGKGTGLGLATVDGFARQAGGAVTVASKEGEGATFSVYLRASVGKRDDARPVRRRRAVTETASMGRVLVVEDDAPLRRMLGRVLEQLHYDVETAGSAEEARTVVRRTGQPDLLVTDTVMPGASGVELAHELLATAPSLRVLFVSGYPDDRELEARARAADRRVAYLDKPFSIAELADAIHELAAR